MRIAMFYHSLRSCWNHGNAHFLRGVVSELSARGHAVTVYEPANGWSVTNLVREHGPSAASAYRVGYPDLESVRYHLDTLDLDHALDGMDLVIVHEWNDPALVARIGDHRRSGGYCLLFHDTHHRAVTAPEEMARLCLREYDGVLAFGEVIRRIYDERGLAARAFTWHEAADVRVFHPRTGVTRGDLVWIGNWGDDERTAELAQFLFEPAAALGLTGTVHGVRYPEAGLEAVKAAGLSYEGWLANHRVPEVFSRFRVTVHVPRRPYAEALPGIPTIRPFEAMACGIPLVSAPWRDEEGLFSAGRDYLVARDGEEMRARLYAVLSDADLARELRDNGLRTIRERHTCGHRVDQLLEIVDATRPRRSGGWPAQPTEDLRAAAGGEA